MHKSSFVDRLSTLIYWPALVLAVVIAIAAPFVEFSQLISPTIMKWSTMAVGGIDVPLFLIVSFSSRTREGIGARNAAARAAWPSQSWPERLYYLPGDMRFRHISLIIFIEIVLSQVVGNKPLGLLLFLSFMLSGLMMMLNMRAYSAATGEHRP